MHSTLHALQAGAAAPESGEGLRRTTGQALWDHECSNGIDSDGSAAERQDADAKHFATLQARAALGGFELVRLADGSFMAARWTRTRIVLNLEAVEAFLAQVGVA